VKQTFAEIPQAEHFITIQNGDPGLKRLSVRVNGGRSWILRLDDNQDETIDVFSDMVAGDNTITLIGYGKSGTSALVIISDSGEAQEEGASLGSGRTDQLQRVPHDWWKDRHQRTGVNLVWGKEVEW
jgi:hypothetical protein